MCLGSVNWIMESGVHRARSKEENSFPRRVTISKSLSLKISLDCIRKRHIAKELKCLMLDPHTVVYIR